MRIEYYKANGMDNAIVVENYTTAGHWDKTLTQHNICGTIIFLDWMTGRYFDTANTLVAIWHIKPKNL